MGLPFQKRTEDLFKGALGIPLTTEVDPDLLFAQYFEQHVASMEYTGLRTDADTTLSRVDVNNNAVPTGTQALRLTFFRARKTEQINTITTYTGGTAAAATPTICRYGIYTVDDNVDGLVALVASTPNDTTLFAATNTAYPKALSASWSKVAGQRYALALLVVTGVAAPTFEGFIAPSDPAPFRAEYAAGPRLSAQVTGQADLPAGPVSSGSYVASSAMVYARFS